MKSLVLFLFITLRLYASTIVTENDPSTLVEGLVSIITGDLYLAEEDIAIEGAEPLHLKRHFITKSWNISFFQHLSAFYFPKQQGISIYERNGSMLLFRKKADNDFFTLLDFSQLPGISNTGRGFISAMTNLKNYRITFSNDTFSLLIANGNARHYRKAGFQDFTDRVRYVLECEELPNGNKIVYDYAANQFVSMRTTNPDGKKTYAKATFEYKPQGTRADFDIHTSDGRTLQYRTKPFVKNKAGTGACFERIISPEYPDETFEYTQVDGAPHLTRVSLPNGRSFSITYDSKGRVKQLLAPTGVATHTFTYFSEKDRRTDVKDSEGAMTRYFWSKEMRLTQIERYTQSGSLYNSEKFNWDMDGNLSLRTLYDSDSQPIFSRLYIYDPNGNIFFETFCGNLTGSSTLTVAPDGRPENGEKHTKFYSYDERHNVTWEREAHGKETCYTYLPGTNLCTAKVITDFSSVHGQRHFFVYNSDHIVIREIEDNGKSMDPNDLSLVTIRKIKDLHLMEEGPYINMPKIIEEKYWNSGQEHLLKRTVFTYTTGGNVAMQEVYDANGKWRYTLKTEYDNKGRPIAETNALGQTALSQYDENGNKIFFQDFSAAKKQMSYDLSNRLTRATENGRTTQHTYDDKGNKIQTIDFRGHTTRYKYDNYGNLIETHLPSGERLKKSYDGAGREISSTDANGNTTSKRYNAYGKPTEILYPDNSKEQFVYNEDGTLKTHTDQVGTQTHYIYDKQGRLNDKKTDDHIEKYSYDGFNLQSKFDAEGYRTLYLHDNAGRKIIESRVDRRSMYSYDALGCVSKVSQDDLSTIKEYDLLGRVLSEKKQDKNGIILAQEEYAYDAAGNQTAIIRYPNNQKAEELSVYDAFNRLIRKVDPLGHETTISYDDYFINPYGEQVLQKITQDPLGILTVEIHDIKNRLISCTKKNSQGVMLSLEEYTYDGNDNVCRQDSSVFAAGVPERQVTTLWQYDSMNRLVVLTEASGTAEERTTTHTYTPKGLLAQNTKPAGTTIQHTYDAFGRCIETCSSDGTVHYTYQYNKIGQLLSSKDELTGLATQKQWNAHGQLLHELLSNALSLTSSYDTQGRRTVLQLPNNRSIAYSYDPLYLRSVTYQHTHYFTQYDLAENLLEEELVGSLGILQYQVDPLRRTYAESCPYYTQHVLKFDAVGNILSMQFPEETVDYSYDDLNQLTEETGLFAHIYSYDSHYNRTRKDEQGYLINSLNQNPSCTYDLNGNPLSYRLWRMQYDAFDRLICIEDPRQRLTFTYDADHRRLSKQVYAKENGQWILKKQLHFLYDGQNEIGSVNEQGEFQELRILGRTPHAEIGSAIAIEINGELYAPIHDLQGNLCTLVSVKDPQKVEHYRFSAFGEEQAPGATCPWRFSSKRTDESGLVYYGRRYYNPHLGRWLTPDPLGLSAGVNLYAFVNNDPLIKVDDYGLMAGIYWLQYASKGISDTRQRFYGAMFGAKDFAVDTFNFAATIGWGVAVPFYYAPRWALGYSTPGQDWKYFQSSNQDFHRVTDRWMQRCLPADIHHTGFQLGRNASRIGCEIGAAYAGGVGLAKTGFSLGKRGYSALRTANNSKWMQQWLREGSRDLNQIEILKSHLPGKTPVQSNSWTNFINPFKGKTFSEIDQLLRAKGFIVKGFDPLHGKGCYFSPITKRKYYFDYAGKTYRGGITELPHVDVHYNNPVNGIEKKRFPIGEYLYEYE